MKRFILLLAASLFVVSAYTQEPDTIAEDIQAPDTLQPVEEPGAVKNLSGEKKDTIRIKIGKKGIAITEDPSGTSVKVIELDTSAVEENAKGKEEKSQESDEKPHRVKMNGHWSGFGFGLNNFVDKDFSLSRTPENQFMDLNTGRSWNINLNLFEQSFGFGTDRFGLVTGLGFAFNNYFFDGNNSITVDSLGNTVSLNYTSQGIDLEKSKLATTYLNIPLLLEYQFPGPSKSKRLYVSAGILGGMKLGSHTKVVYRQDGKQKDKIRSDFNLSPLRYAYTARVGYKSLQVYANYYPTPLFEKNKGPELYPFDIGLCLTF